MRRMCRTHLFYVVSGAKTRIRTQSVLSKHLKVNQEAAYGCEHAERVPNRQIVKSLGVYALIVLVSFRSWS